jgi:hypothetical protein
MLFILCILEKKKTEKFNYINVSIKKTLKISKEEHNAKVKERVSETSLRYGIETWIMLERCKSRLQESEMRSLRSVTRHIRTGKLGTKISDKN